MVSLHISSTWMINKMQGHHITIFFRIIFHNIKKKKVVSFRQKARLNLAPSPYRPKIVSPQSKLGSLLDTARDIDRHKIYTI